MDFHLDKHTYLNIKMPSVILTAAVLVEMVAAPAYLAVPQAGGHTGMIVSTHKKAHYSKATQCNIMLI